MASAVRVAVLNPGLISAINEALNEDGKDVVIKEGIDFGFTESSPSSVDIVVPEGRTLHVNGEVSASGIIIIVDGGTINNHGGALTITTLTIKDGGTLTNNRRRGTRDPHEGTITNNGGSARTSVESAKHVKNVSRTRWISPPWQRRRGQRWHAEGELNLRFSSTCFIMSLCVFKRAGRYPGPRRRGEGVLVSLATAKESSSPRRRHGSEVPECCFLGAAGEAVGQD